MRSSRLNGRSMPLSTTSSSIPHCFFFRSHPQSYPCPQPRLQTHSSPKAHGAASHDQRAITLHWQFPRCKGVDAVSNCAWVRACACLCIYLLCISIPVADATQPPGGSLRVSVYTPVPNASPHKKYFFRKSGACIWGGGLHLGEKQKSGWIE